MNLRTQEKIIIDSIKKNEESEELKTLREMNSNMKKLLELMSAQQTSKPKVVYKYKTEKPQKVESKNIEKVSDKSSDFIPSIDIGKMEIKSTNVKTSTKTTNMDDVLSSLENLNIGENKNG